MARTETVREQGLFSELPGLAYGEDSDLSLKLREAGYTLHWVPVAIVHPARLDLALSARGAGLDGHKPRLSAVKVVRIPENSPVCLRAYGFLCVSSLTRTPVVPMSAPAPSPTSQWCVVPSSMPIGAQISWAASANGIGILVVAYSGHV